MASTVKEEAAPPRQRKSHRKSRLGCGNCKLRSIKCDESKPSCTRCLTSGFTCSYTYSALPLQVAVTGCFKLDLSPALAPPRPKLSIPVALPVAGKIGEYEMREGDFAALDRFKKRTILTVGSKTTRHLYRDGAFELGVTHPFLVHIFLAFALLHDIFLSPSATTSAQRSALAFHWYHGTVLFKRKLNQASLTASERDALWASAALLGAASFAFVDSGDPLNAWPLKDPGPMDLDWLKMSDGKRVVWQIADPTRPESIFNPLVQAFKGHSVPDGSRPIPPSVLPHAFYTLFDLSPASTPATNPYHVAASLIAQLLPVPITDDTILKFLAFISQLDPRFRQLLEQKEPRALLLLAWWCQQTCVHSAWWLQRRSLVEGQAICMYLQKNCKDQPKMMELVKCPKMIFELVAKGELKDPYRAVEVTATSLRDLK